MRRLFARVLLTFALLAGSLGFWGWWLEHTALDPTRAERMTSAVLDDADLRSAIADRLASAVADQLPAALAPSRETLAATLSQPGAVDAVAALLGDIHARAVGAEDGPVTVPASLLPAAAAALPPVTFTVPKAGPLAGARRTLADAVPLLVGLALVLAAGAAFVHPDRRWALRRIGVGLMGIAGGHLVLGWVLPVLVLPHLSTSLAPRLVTALARAAMTPMVATLATLVGTGGGLYLLGRLLPAPASRDERRARRRAAPQAPAAATAAPPAPLPATSWPGQPGWPNPRVAPPVAAPAEPVGARWSAAHDRDGDGWGL